MTRKVLWLVIALVFLNSAEGVSAKTVYDFQGELDLLKDQFDLTMDSHQEGSIVLSLKPTVEDDYQLLINIDRLKLPQFEWSTQLDALLKITSLSDIFYQSFSGKIRSRYSLFDYKPPSKELSGRFTVDENRRMILSSIKYGDLTTNGFVDLKYPFRFDTTFRLAQMDLKRFIYFWAPDSTIEIQGSVDGIIKAYGTPDQIQLKGDLKSQKGVLSKLNFDSIDLHAQGIYPLLMISKSMIIKTGGESFGVDGNFDLKGKRTYKARLSKLTLSPLVKGSADDLKREWTLRQEEGKFGENTKFGYFLQKTDGEDDKLTDMLGVEQKIEF